MIPRYFHERVEKIRNYLIRGVFAKAGHSGNWCKTKAVAAKKKRSLHVINKGFLSGTPLSTLIDRKSVV